MHTDGHTPSTSPLGFMTPYIPTLISLPAAPYVCVCVINVVDCIDTGFLCLSVCLSLSARICPQNTVRKIALDASGEIKIQAS